MPTAIWCGLNLFRLVAITFMTWAFVAQFISLADEVKAIHSNSNNTTISPLAAASGTPAVTKWDIAGSMTVDGAGTPAMAAISSSTSATPPAGLRTFIASPPEEPTTFTSTFNASQRVPLPTRSTLDSDSMTKAVQPLVGPVGNLRVRNYRRRLRRQAEPRGAQPEKAGEDVSKLREVGLTQQGPRTDLVAWVVISRLMIGALLTLAIVAQLGIPEVHLHDHVAWLGPQSTPISLGGLQTLCSIEILRAEAKEVNLIPGYALLGIGLLNIVIGMALLYLGRNLPKDPPPPLYFNHAQRLLFWRPTPSFYAKVLNPALPIHREEPLQEEPPQLRDRKGRLPRSNAHEIGLDDTDTEEEKQDHLDLAGEAPRFVNGARAMTAEEDVLRGGYPTFAAGSSIDQPGRHVPAGTLEQDRWGMPTRFTREDELDARPKPRLTRTQPHITNPALLQRRDSAFDDIQADLVGSPRPPHTLPRGKADSTNPPKQRPTPPSELAADLYRAASSASNNSAYSGISRSKSSRQSSATPAVKDIGAHFPLPPHRTGHVLTKEAGRDRKARRPNDLGPGRGSGRSSAVPARVPLSPAKRVRSSTALSIKSKGRTPRVSVVEKPTTATDASTPKTPHTPKTPLPSPSPVSLSARITEAQYGQVTAGQIIDRQLSASPEVLAEEPQRMVPPEPPTPQRRARSATTSSAEAPKPSQSSIRRASSVQPARLPRGVRFDLSSVEEESEVEFPASTPRTGIRIPGTSFHLPLPALLSPISNRRRHSLDLTSHASFDTQANSARPLSTAAIQPMKRDPDMLESEKVVHRHSSAILGGNYLAGGKEVLQ